MACTPNHASTVTFAASGVTTLTVPSPRLGNGESLDPHIIIHRTRSGDVYCYKRGSLLKSFPLNFDKLKKDDMDLFRTFIADSAGKVITYTNHFGTAYTGYLRNISVREVARELGFEVELTFELA